MTPEPAVPSLQRVCESMPGQYSPGLFLPLRSTQLGSTQHSILGRGVGRSDLIRASLWEVCVVTPEDLALGKDCID